MCYLIFDMDFLIFHKSLQNFIIDSECDIIIKVLWPLNLSIDSNKPISVNESRDEVGSSNIII